MNNTLKSVGIVLAVIFVIFLIGLGAIYVYSEDSKYDWDEMEAKYVTPTVEVQEVTPGYNPYDEENQDTDYKFVTEDITDIYVYSKSSTDPKQKYFFEYRLEDGRLYFSCHYETDESVYDIEDEQMDAIRLNEAFDVINRYTLASTIRDYREGVAITPATYVQGEDDPVKDRGINISWSDGDTCRFGCPNGATDALVRYFESVVEWVSTNPWTDN